MKVFSFDDWVKHKSPSNYEVGSWPDGEYRGTIKGDSVWSDELDSGFETTRGIGGISDCTILVHDGKISVHLPDGSEYKPKKEKKKSKL